MITMPRYRLFFESDYDDGTADPVTIEEQVEIDAPNGASARSIFRSAHPDAALIAIERVNP